MGQRASTTRKNSFSDVLPSSQRAKQPTARADSPAAARPVETTIPAIHAPPHALLQRPSAVSTDATVLMSSRRSTADAFAVPESVRKSRTLEQYEQTCSEILPQFLYVSNLQVAQDREHLDRVGITHVINCCKEIACSPPPHEDESIAYLQLALRDGVQEDLCPFFPHVIDFVDQCKTQGGRVLIHCHQGVSRSCAFAIAYVMYCDRCSFLVANAFVKARRAICSPNTAFICQLIEWERDLAAAETESTADYGLYRLAPHAAYDSSTLVLKLCYHEDTRRKVAIGSDRLEWLWSRGLFVFMDDNKRELVIWKGSQCTIPDGVNQAKERAQRMLRVLAGEVVAADVTMTVIDGDEHGGGGIDHFSYASELAWMPSVADSPLATDTLTGNACMPPGGNESSDSWQTEPLPAEKPMLFLLEGTSVWEQLTNYDSDDLLASSVLLLVAPTQTYLWLGKDHSMSTTETLVPIAHQQLTRCGKLGRVYFEIQDEESEGFWEAFEAGY